MSADSTCPISASCRWNGSLGAWVEQDQRRDGTLGVLQRALRLGTDDDPTTEAFACGAEHPRDRLFILDDQYERGHVGHSAGASQTLP